MLGQGWVREYFEEELGRQFPFTRRGRPLPALDQSTLDVSHHGLGDARVRDPVHPAFVEGLFVLSGQISPRRNDLIFPSREQVEDVLFEIGTGTGDRMYLPGTDHTGQRNSKFPRRHRPRHRDEHPATCVHVCLICLRCIDDFTSVEVQVVRRHEVADRAQLNSPVAVLGSRSLRIGRRHDRLLS